MPLVCACIHFESKMEKQDLQAGESRLQNCSSTTTQIKELERKGTKTWIEKDGSKPGSSSHD